MGLSSGIIGLLDFPVSNSCQAKQNSILSDHFSRRITMIRHALLRFVGSTAGNFDSAVRSSIPHITRIEPTSTWRPCTSIESGRDIISIHKRAAGRISRLATLAVH